MLAVFPRYRTLPLPSGLVLSLNKCYLVFALSMNMIRSCLLQYCYSSKSENNCCSVYMNKTFYGHTPSVNGLLNLDRSNTHIYNIDAKRCKINNDSATYLWQCRLGHIGIKRMKKLHADGILESLDACEPCLMGKMTKDSVLRNNGASNRFVGNHTY